MSHILVVLQFQQTLLRECFRIHIEAKNNNFLAEVNGLPKTFYHKLNKLIARLSRKANCSPVVSITNNYLLYKFILYLFKFCSSIHALSGKKNIKKMLLYSFTFGDRLVLCSICKEFNKEVGRASICSLLLCRFNMRKAFDC